LRLFNARDCAVVVAFPTAERFPERISRKEKKGNHDEEQFREVRFSRWVVAAGYFFKLCMLIITTVLWCLIRELERMS
jgi:hypothetical protein